MAFVLKFFLFQAVWLGDLPLDMWHGRRWSPASPLLWSLEVKKPNPIWPLIWGLRICNPPVARFANDRGTPVVCYAGWWIDYNVLEIEQKRGKIWSTSEEGEKRRRSSTSTSVVCPLFHLVQKRENFWFCVVFFKIILPPSQNKCLVYKIRTPKWYIFFKKKFNLVS